MSVDRDHGIRAGMEYPAGPAGQDYEPKDEQEFADVQPSGDTYQIPQPRDEHQEFAKRTLDFVTGDEGEKKRKLSFGTKVGVGITALSLAGAAVFAGAGLAKNDKNAEPTPGNNEPTVSAPAVPGATETSTADKEPVTSETVEFTVDGKTYKGVMTDNGIVANFGTFRQNDPKLPAPTEKESSNIVSRYAYAVQVFNNMMVSDEVKPFRDEAMDKALFKPGTNGALETFVKQNQENGTKIVTIEPFSDPTSLKSGGIDVIQSGFYATTDKGERFRIDTTLVNNSGAMVNDGTSFISPSPIE